MKFEWNPKKAESNLKKHKISFVEACYVFADTDILTLYDQDHSDEEERWISIGNTSNGEIVVAHTYVEKDNEEVARIISARKATKKEREQYFERRKDKS